MIPPVPLDSLPSWGLVSILLFLRDVTCCCTKAEDNVAFKRLLLVATSNDPSRPTLEGLTIQTTGSQPVIQTNPAKVVSFNSDDNASRAVPEDLAEYNRIVFLH